MTYCKLCVYFSQTEKNKGVCQYPENIDKEHTWYYWEQKYDEKPRQKNKNNDCEWFKMKGK